MARSRFLPRRICRYRDRHPDAPGLPVTKALSGAEVYIISPKDGASVGENVAVLFVLEGMSVVPAGVDKEHTGHHHLLVDVTDLALAGQPIPKDETHLHFGGGQTETTLKPKRGRRTLQLEWGDSNHVPLDPAVVSKKITTHIK